MTENRYFKFSAFLIRFCCTAELQQTATMPSIRIWSLKQF